MRYAIHPGPAYLFHDNLPLPENRSVFSFQPACPDHLFRDLHELAGLAHRAGFQLTVARITDQLPMYLTTTRYNMPGATPMQWCDTHITARQRLEAYFKAHLPAPVLELTN